jgi:hypothetical protein
MIAKRDIVYCASPRDGDTAPTATENFFAFPLIEDFIDQQTPAEHKHRAMSRCAFSLILFFRFVLSICAVPLSLQIVPSSLILRYTHVHFNDVLFLRSMFMTTLAFPISHKMARNSLNFSGAHVYLRLAQLPSQR